MTALWKHGALALLVAAMVAGCGNGSDGPGGGTAGGIPTSFSFKEAFSKLEASGQLPVLDRSDSIAGPDVNANGVRDDMERYIDSKPDTPAQKNSLKSASRVLSEAMTVNLNDKNALRGVVNKMNISVICVHEKYPLGKGSSMLREIEKLTVNTRKRYDAYMKFNSALNGSVVKHVKEVNCD